MFDLMPYAKKHSDALSRAFYDPFRELEEMERSFFANRKLPDFRTDIREQDGAYLLEAELPGFKKEDIHLDLQDGYLTISAERSSENEEKDENGRYLKRERSYGSFCRSFDMSGIDTENIKAAYQDGVLSLTLPKLIEQPKNSRRLEIE